MAEIKASAYNAGDPGSIPGSGRSPGEGHSIPPVFLPGESRGQRSLAGYSPQGRIELDTIAATKRAHMYVDTYVHIRMYVWFFLTELATIPRKR